MWALVNDGLVIEVTDIDPTGRFHDSIKWIKCDPPISAGYSRIDGEFRPPSPGLAYDWQGGKWEIDAAKQAALDAQSIKALAAKIDDAVGAIYARLNQYSLEYQAREAQAQAYKDGGYTGPVPQQVAAFATPAGKPAKEATDIILAQAATLRGALAQLGVLRMRKYEVLNAADVATAQAKADGVLAAVVQIGAKL